MPLLKLINPCNYVDLLSFQQACNKLCIVPEYVVEVKVVVVVDTIGVTVGSWGCGVSFSYFISSLKDFLNFFLEPCIDVIHVHLPISLFSNCFILIPHEFCFENF